MGSTLRTDIISILADASPLCFQWVIETMYIYIYIYSFI